MSFVCKEEAAILWRLNRIIDADATPEHKSEGKGLIRELLEIRDNQVRTAEEKAKFKDLLVNGVVSKEALRKDYPDLRKFTTDPRYAKARLVYDQGEKAITVMLEHLEQGSFVSFVMPDDPDVQMAVFKLQDNASFRLGVLNTYATTILPAVDVDRRMWRLVIHPEGKEPPRLDDTIEWRSWHNAGTIHVNKEEEDKVPVVSYCQSIDLDFKDLVQFHEEQPKEKESIFRAIITNGVVTYQTMVPIPEKKDPQMPDLVDDNEFPEIIKPKTAEEAKELYKTRNVAVMEENCRGGSCGG